MVTVGVGILWFGYVVTSYGVALIGGCNPGFLALMVPGKFTGCHPDAPGAKTPSTAGKPGGGAPVQHGLTKAQCKKDNLQWYKGKCYAPVGSVASGKNGPG